MAKCPQDQTAKWKQPCSEKHLRAISQEIADWQDIAPFLDLTAADVVVVIGSPPRPVQAQKIETLRIWKQKLGVKGTYEKLAEAFQSCSRQDLVDKINEFLTEDKISSSEKTIFIPEAYQKDFDKVKCEFALLFDNVTTIIEEAQVSLEGLKKFLTHFIELEKPLQRANTIDKVIKVVQTKSSFINCVYLTYLARRFNLPAAEKRIDAYYKFVEEFCQHGLTQHSYVTSFLAESRHLHPSETITFTLEWKPEDKTLADIQGIIREIFKSLADRIHIVVVGGGSVTVTCYAPQRLMSALVRMAQENVKVVVETGVTYLSVGYAVMLDNSAQKEISSLEDQIFTLKKEKEELQLELKKIQELEEQLDLEQTKTALTYQLGKKEEIIQHMKNESQEEKISTLTQEKKALELQVKVLQGKLQSQLEKMEQEKADFESQVKTIQGMWYIHMLKMTIMAFCLLVYVL